MKKTRHRPLRVSIARWQHAVRVLERINDEKFSWGTWGAHLNAAHQPIEDNYCGTFACIAGWCSLDPWFRERGLTSRWRSDCDGWSLSVRLPVTFFEDGHGGSALLWGENPEGEPPIRSTSRRAAIAAVKWHIKRLKEIMAERRRLTG